MDILKRIPGTQKDSWVYFFKNQLYYADIRDLVHHTPGVYLRCKHKKVCPASIYLPNLVDCIGKPVEVIGEHINHQNYENEIEYRNFKSAVTKRAIDEWTPLKTIFDEEMIKPE